jgi:hypothetical protein
LVIHWRQLALWLLLPKVNKVEGTAHGSLLVAPDWTDKQLPARALLLQQRHREQQQVIKELFDYGNKLFSDKVVEEIKDLQEQQRRMEWVNRILTEYLQLLEGLAKSVNFQQVRKLAKILKLETETADLKTKAALLGPIRTKLEAFKPNGHTDAPAGDARR